nr:hypothetical protein [Kibdelosporangium sp. MJ126-NF4]CEL23260.1 FIG01132199: hypothetical protein [Kibdelosporangium sp. MJ126-NF4]CTQ94422.1 FIG01132199: hypothetical protein [Kibdelosporangium sp. MJ126-NF4]
MRRVAVVAAIAAVSMSLVPAVAFAAQPVGPWNPVGSDRARPLDESQGLASVVRPGGTTFRYTGIGTIPSGVSSRGWNHVGDPGAGQGFYVEPYQRDDRGSKLFRVQAPDNTWSEYIHALESWEANNNSFSAVSPDGRWMVAGEWGTMSRLLVHPMPGIAFTTPGQNLPLAGQIRLSRPVRDIQGCDFTAPTQLLCSSDDPEGTLFGITKPLLQVDLTSPLTGADVTGTVTALGQLPLESGCGGNFEVEGIDYDEQDGTLRVVVLSPSICVVFDSKTWRFRK